MRTATRLAGSLLTWFALLLQLWLVVSVAGPERGLSTSASIGWYASFMTILTNAWVALAFTLPLIFPHGRVARWLVRPEVQAAVLVYILIVGIVYHLLLAGVWDPQGWFNVADTLLHTVVPVVYLLYWFFFAHKEGVSFKSVPRWLIYPLIYVASALLYGKFTGRYPYPFLDLPKVGWASMMVTCSVILAGYAALGMAVVAICHRLAARTS